MSFRSLRSISSLVAVIALVFVASRPLSADVPRPTVSLILTKASAQRSAIDTLFKCEVRLNNQTDNDLVVRSNFAFAFDGLEVVVTSIDGKMLIQQSHTVHQSPFLEPNTFYLPKGITTSTLVFPVRDFPAEVTAIKIRLVGKLPGSEYQRILSTETLEIKIQP